jgi:hypothetical protein
LSRLGVLQNRNTPGTFTQPPGNGRGFLFRATHEFEQKKQPAISGNKFMFIEKKCGYFTAQVGMSNDSPRLYISYFSGALPQGNRYSNPCEFSRIPPAKPGFAVVPLACAAPYG